VIDDDLMAKAKAATGLTTRKDVIHEALQTVIRLKSQEQTRKLRGKLHWEGNLSEMR
jgi:Arc/MetJ family transcription regulator